MCKTYFLFLFIADFKIGPILSNLSFDKKKKDFLVYLGRGFSFLVHPPPEQLGGICTSPALQMHQRNLKLENLQDKQQQQKSKEITGIFHLSSAMHRSNQTSSSSWYKYESSLSAEFEKCTIYVTFSESRD